MGYWSHAYVSCGWLRMGKAMIGFATSKGKRKAQNSDVKEKKARQAPAKPAKRKSAKAKAKPNLGATRPGMEVWLDIYHLISYLNTIEYQTQ